jgi:hypothetical protein
VFVITGGNYGNKCGVKGCLIFVSFSTLHLILILCILILSVAKWFEEGGAKYRVFADHYEPCCSSNTYDGVMFKEDTEPGAELRDLVSNRNSVVTSIEINTQTHRHTTRVDGFVAGADYYMSHLNYSTYDYLVRCCCCCSLCYHLRHV